MSAQIMAAIDRAWSEAGVVVLVDLGGAETNSEMAIEMLPEDRRGKVLICNAPMVEGAVMAATEAAGGSSVETGAADGGGIFGAMNDGTATDQAADRARSSSRMRSACMRARR